MIIVPPTFVSPISALAQEEDAFAAVEALANEAAAWTTGQLCDEGSANSSAGLTEVRVRQDVCFQVRFLVGAIATGEPGLLQDYVSWLTSALRMRGVPASGVFKALSLLETFFADRLPAALAARVASVIAAGLDILNRQEKRLAAMTDILPPMLNGVEAMTRHLVSGDLEAARALMTQVHGAGNSYIRVATGLFQPALYSVGQLWEDNCITVGQEHLATVITQSLLAQLFVATPLAEPKGCRAIVACVEGNHHSIGAQIAAEALQLAGWNVQFLGGHVPLDSLLAQVDAAHPDVVGLSATMVQNLPSLQRAVLAVRSEFAAHPPAILIGGLATNRLSDAWRRASADLWCRSAEEVMELAQQR